MTTLDQSFTTRQVPWMKIGTIIDDPDVDAAEAARLGGIDFDVDLRPAGYWTPHEQVSEGEHDEQRIDLGDGVRSAVYRDADGGLTARPGYWSHEGSRYAVVRQDTGEWFSFVSTDYRVVQYREAFEFMDNLNPRYVAAGALSGGRQGFLIAQLPEHLRSDITIDGVADPHDMYVVLQTSHDLSKSIKVSVMMLRDKCMNMLTLPTFSTGAVQHWSVIHVGDPHKKLELARHTLEQAANYQETFERLVAQFSSVRITSDDLRHIARRVLPDRLKRKDEQVAAIVDRFEHADTVGFNETGWGAINAVSDYMQWGRPTAIRTAQSEFTSGLEGDTAKYVNRTAQLVMARA
jgi:phage/plasmid-like protein (TIGR03299 family)